MTALLDFLKKKEEAEKSQKSDKKSDKVSAAKNIEKKNKKKEVSEKIQNNIILNSKGFSFEAVKQPHISEKGSYLAEINQYVFDIADSANKNEVKKTIAGIYGVNVLSVNMIKVPPKKRRLGKTQGWRKGYKKAIVTIKEGQKIEIL
jgi:large subunit ribosomal protein L23